MAMNYEELDSKTRAYILSEFEDKESMSPYRSKALSVRGIDVFPELMRRAITSGDEVWLSRQLMVDSYWDPYEEYTRNGATHFRRRNIRQSSERLALTEFSTWYVRGFSKRLLEEKVESCQIYRGAQPKWEPGECTMHEGLVVSVLEIYRNHRARYWPEPGNKYVFSIPFGPGCHHVIRRLK